MSDSILSNRIRTFRRERQWSQKDLAAKSGISRAEVSAVETGRQIPSTATALRLAAVLEQPVEALFALPTPTEAPQWAWPPELPSGRFWEARVGARRLLFPSEPTALGSIAHDGRYGPDGIVRYEGSEPDRTLVVAGCDPAVGLLASELMARDRIRLLPLTRGSRDALRLVELGSVHAAGVHWSDDEREDANNSMVARVLGSGYRLLHVTRWQEGVALEPSIRARSARAVKSARLRWIAREEGSGARHVLDRLLAGKAPRFRYHARDHRSVALAIQSGYAQAGIAVKMAAEEHGLDFVTLSHEDYDLCFSGELKSTEPIVALRAALKRSALKRLTGDLPGLDVDRMGEERAVA